MELKDSQTQKNLMTAFLRESGAYNQYYYYAMQAKQEGYQAIYQTFNQFALNEQAHAKVWFKLFHGIGGTAENLKSASELENFERTKLYAEFSRVAKEEGFTDIAKLFDGVAKIEKRHEQTYKTLSEQVKNEKVFTSPDKVKWMCLNCGHIHVGLNPPTTCPVCSHPIAYFKILEDE